VRTHPKTTSNLAWASLAAFAFAVSGCGGGLQLKTIKATQKRPSNVALYFKVQNTSGDGIGGLNADQFRIYEDGSLISPYESKQVILNPEVAAAHYTLLLVDMSGSVSESGASGTVVDAASTFVERVETQQKVGVYAFDGSSNLHPISPFQSAGGAKGGVRSLASFKPQDPSTNLNGAVVKALSELDQALAHDPAPLKFGTLVVFTDGTDRAARVTRDDMRKAVKESQYDVFAIGLGAELKKGGLDDVGKSGTALAENREAVVQAFDTIAQKVEGQTKSYYLLGYCSPARAGKHRVTVEAVYKPDEKSAERTGRTESEFDATGFEPGCDPKSPPNFDVTKGDALVPKEEGKDEKKDDKKDKEKDKEKDKDRDKKPAAKPKPAGPPSLPPPPPPSAAQSQSPSPPPAKQDFNP
jgi:hypothetical protein